MAIFILIVIIAGGFFIYNSNIKYGKELKEKAKSIGLVKCNKCCKDGFLKVCFNRRNDFGRFVCEQCGSFDWKKIISQKNEFDESELNLSKSTKVTLMADSKIKECLDNFDIPLRKNKQE